MSERGRVSKNGAWTFGRASVESGAFVVKQFEVVCTGHTAGYSLKQQTKSLGYYRLRNIRDPCNLK